MTLTQILAGALLFACAPTAAAAAPTPAFDRAAWKADFERIKLGLAQGYANLDWQVEKRNFNLKRADERIGSMLDKSNSDVEAALIIARLVDAFHDPHLQLQFGPPPIPATLLPRQSNIDGPTPAADVCAADHYADGKPGTRLPYSTAPGWTSLSDGPFLAGSIGEIGIVRIPAFGEDRYLSACRRVAKAGLSGRDLQLATRAELNRQLAEIVQALRQRGVTKLAIDVSGNGGGSEWSSEVAAMLAGGTLKRVAPRQVGPACDRAAIWTGAKVCSIYAKPAETETMAGTGLWTGPLAVLTDRQSASAAEEFVTWLKDNDRAVIAGERTFGAGCGYIDGGSAIALKAAPLHIMVPNCSRYTREGVNEIEGIAPHVAIDWSSLKLADVSKALAALFERKS